MENVLIAEELITTRKNKEVESVHKNSLKNESRLELMRKKLPIATVDSGEIIKLNKHLLELNAKGMQHKGPVLLEDGGEETLRFIKLDEINPKTNMRFLDYMDYHYSSISEAICSAFLSSLEPKEGFESLLYTFEIIERNGEFATGVLSNNYLYDQDDVDLDEKILSIEQGKLLPSDEILVEHNEFIDNIIDSINKEHILSKMIEYFTRYGVNEEKAKRFILNQAAFDTITCNYDRKPNSTNFVFIETSETGETKPFNIDYGRALVMEISLDSYDILNNIPEDEKEVEIKQSADFYIDTYLGKGGIFSGGSSRIQLAESVDFILNNGFEPFELHKSKLEQKFENLIEKVKTYNQKDLKMFTQIKIEMLKQLLENKELKRLWKEVNS